MLCRMAPKKSNPMSEVDVDRLIARQLEAAIPDIVSCIAASINNTTNSNPVSNRTTTNNDGERTGPTPSVETNRTGPAPVAKGCSIKDFMLCKPLEFSGIEGPNGLVKWIEKIESIVNICNCPEEYIVKYAANTFADHALTWWKTIVQTRGQEATNRMTWTELKALVLEHFCPKNELQKLENELWNLEMQGADHIGYTNRFNELSRLVPWLVTPESKRVERYIWGLTPVVRGIVNSGGHQTFESAVTQAGIVTYDFVRSGSLKAAGESAGGKRGTYDNRIQEKHPNKRA